MKVLQGFYRCFIVSLLSFSSVCWYGRLSEKRKNVLNRAVNVCSKVVGERHVSVNGKVCAKEGMVICKGQQICSGSAL